EMMQPLVQAPVAPRLVGLGKPENFSHQSLEEQLRDMLRGRSDKLQGDQRKATWMS
ncbi:hypothetical protein HDU93_005099, partial [Gonapodya sp. JEL0774]